MLTLHLTEELKEVLKRIIWFEKPEESIKNPLRVLAYAMTYATHEDMSLLRKQISSKDFLEALDQIPPGIVDERSWAYWNLLLGRYPPPSPPQRILP